MTTTIDDVLVVARSSGPIERSQFTQLLVDVSTRADLSDQFILTIIRSVFSVQTRLTGNPARIERPLRDQLFAHLRSKSQNDGNGRAFATMVAIECAGQPIKQAVFGLMEDILLSPAGQASGVDFAQRVLSMIGVSFSLSDGVLKHIGTMMVDRAPDMGPILAGLSFLNFKAAESINRRQPIFQNVVHPLLIHLARIGAADAALVLEQHIYNDHIKALERPEHHTAIFSAIAEPMRTLGTAHAQKLPALPAVPPRRRPRIAFFLHNGNRLAHVEVLLSFLSGLARSDNPAIEPVVYLLFDHGYDDLAAACKRFGVEVVAARLPFSTPLTSRFEHCRQQLAALGAAGIVFVSIPLHLEYLSSFHLAPISIWWSMKFPLPNFPALDGRVFYRLLFPGRVTIEGQIWYGGPLGLDIPAKPDSKSVQEIRSKYAGGPILGTVAREEKIREPAYLAAVAKIMHLHPTASFLWTGRQQLSEITDFFNAEGIAHRCHFIGWVDPALYCQVFDLFLETFPLTGLMSGWAMAFGQAVVTAGSLGWLGTYLAGIYDGSIPCTPMDRERLQDVFAAVSDRVPCIWAKDPDEFVLLATVLLGDETLRHDFGQCCQRFMAQFLTDGVRSAEVQAQFFADIVLASRDIGEAF